MEAVRPVALALPSLAVESPPLGFAASRASLPERQPLDPAVSVELSPKAGALAPEPERRRGFERDAVSEALVYRVTDAVTGDVIVQIPDEVILKARAYSRQPDASVGVRVEKSV